MKLRDENGKFMTDNWINRLLARIRAALKAWRTAA